MAGLVLGAGGVDVADAAGKVSGSLEAAFSSLAGWLFNFDSSLAMQTPVTHPNIQRPEFVLAHLLAVRLPIKQRAKNSAEAALASLTLAIVSGVEACEECEPFRFGKGGSYFVSISAAPVVTRLVRQSPVAYRVGSQCTRRKKGVSRCCHPASLGISPLR
jgi:hypothetical protein